MHYLIEKYKFILRTAIYAGLYFYASAGLAYDVTVKTDTGAGSADIAERVEYRIDDGDCHISWFTSRRKSDQQLVLSVTRNCPLSFEDQADYHEEILERITQDIPIAQFTSLNWESFSYQNDNSWIIAVALGSDRSKIYKDYRQNYPRAKINDINQVFVEIANEQRPYEPLALLFHEYDVTLVLTSVEKVFSSRADKLPFYEDLVEHSVGRNAYVIYDAGMTYFRLIPWQRVY